MIEMELYEYDQRHQIKKQLPAGVHLMNANESKCLRRIMSETGMSEDKI